MKDIIEKHAVMLLALYGVKKKKVDKDPEALAVFTRLLAKEINKKTTLFKRPVYALTEWQRQYNVKHGYPLDFCLPNERNMGYNEAIDEIEKLRGV